MAEVSVGGGVSVTITDPATATAVGNAIQRAVGATTTGGTPRYPGGTDSVGSGHGNPGFWDVLNVTGSTSTVDVAGTGVEAIVDNGTGDDTLTGGLQTQIIIGNDGNDVITTERGGSVVTGSGDNTVDLTNGTGGPVVDNLYLGAGTNTVNVGAGVDTVNVFGGNGDIETTDANTVVNLRTASDVTVSGAGGHIAGVGNDTITIDASTGAGLLITEHGSATVFGGADVNGFEFKGGSGNDSVVAGSGATTLIGGSGKEFLQGGAGSLKFVAGSGDNTVVAGLGASTLQGGTTAASNLYEFDTQAGGVANGTASIFNFTEGRDHIKLGAGEATQSVVTNAGGATITLTDGTKILVHGTFNAGTDII